MTKLILLRHGQSQWNKENRFTGWVDVGLSDRGIEEAQNAGKTLVDKGLHFDAVYTSVLKRAIKTCWLALEAADMMGLPVTKSWQLNERHYGALQGKNKQEMRNEFGEEQVHRWRRGYAVTPPALEHFELPHPEYYPGLTAAPLTESLELTVKRVESFWQKELLPQVLTDKRLLIAAHGNSLRALIKVICGISDEDIIGVEVPTGTPILLECDSLGQAKDFTFLSNT